MEEISSILFFLMGAMTIVELIDAHEGFRVITDRIQTRNKVKMLVDCLRVDVLFFRVARQFDHVDCDGVAFAQAH